MQHVGRRAVSWHTLLRLKLPRHSYIAKRVRWKVHARGPQGILQTENAPFKNVQLYLFDSEKRYLRSVEGKFSKSVSGRPSIHLNTCGTCVSRETKVASNCGRQRIRQITFNLPNVRYKYTMQRRQPIFKREHGSRGNSTCEISDV